MSAMLLEKYRRCVLVSCIVLGTPGWFASPATAAAAVDSTGSLKVLKIITINVWSGLDYHGFFNFGEYEPEGRRELRFQLLVAQLRNLDPDIIFIQEANPVGSYSSRLADSLSFDQVHQVCNAGIKIVGLGPPWNLEEGIAILTRKNLSLRGYEVWKLSGSFGLYGDIFSMNFDESEFAQVATIELDGRPAFLINVHLSAFPPEDSSMTDELKSRLSSGEFAPEAYREARKILSYGSYRRRQEVSELLDRISGLPRNIPVILGGDFNAEPQLSEIGMIESRGNFTDVSAPSGHPLTWDPTRNSNIAFSTQFLTADGDDLDLKGKLDAFYDARPREIDYVFVSRRFAEGNLLGAQVVLDSSAGGVYTSDHFGVMAEIKVPAPPANMAKDENYADEMSRSHVEPLPILSYDTDIGFGYGAKLFLFDLMKMKESFDLVAFNSTKGERWYRGVFSYPDLEWREGKEYSLAVDLTFDYDKWLANNFYGIGNGSLFANREQYTRVPIELSAAFSRGFSPELVGQIVLKYKSIENYGFDSTSRLRNLPPSLNASTARFSSVGINLRYDTRNSFINPSEGAVLQGESEYALPGAAGNVSFVRLAGWFQYYHKLFYPVTVFALRLGVQQVAGDNLPVQVLTSIGGNNTLRGFTQDRFLDKSAALLNAEIRFPIFWRLGGVVGFDAGKVWSSFAKADLARWATNPVAGLRLYMDNFVVRADFGFGAEGTGFYFNFGHMF